MVDFVPEGIVSILQEFLPQTTEFLRRFSSLLPELRIPSMEKVIDCFELSWAMFRLCCVTHKFAGWLLMPLFTVSSSACGKTPEIRAGPYGVGPALTLHRQCCDWSVGEVLIRKSLKII